LDLNRLLEEINKLDADDLLVAHQQVLRRQQALGSHEVVGILADIHGDLEGFRNALVIFEQHGVKRILCAGDVVDRGSSADEIVHIIQEMGIICIAGNHDRTVVTNQARWRAKDNAERLREVGRIVSDETIEFLKTLPDFDHITIAGKRILIAHGVPWSDVIGVFPDSRQSTFDRIYREYGEDYDIILLGHTHHPIHAQIDALTILNPGSIYGVTIRDSHTCAILKLPSLDFDLYDVHSGEQIELDIIQR